MIRWGGGPCIPLIMPSTCRSGAALEEFYAEDPIVNLFVMALVGERDVSALRYACLLRRVGSWGSSEGGRTDLLDLRKPCLASCHVSLAT